ncbi:tripartite motif-containing protein 16-like [Perca flavescens]|uniref:tripartite motif-containing protein 16-like n=1 Tax=Perca flavescens TaxID=8167 RepID=UPI00106EA0EF|nr:tripartite motif-containing protein 16-like [Perca flavescens]
MAQKGVQLDPETFSCSICLDLLKDPVTTSCGHNYCMNCIKSHWDEEDHKNIHSCPQCRQTFTPRPVLLKNNLLVVLVEELKKTGLHAAPADHCYAGAEDVEHKGHDTVPAAAERTERLKKLEGSRLNIQQRIQDKEKDVKLLQQQVEAINLSADKAVEDSEKIFTELIRLLEKRSSDVKQQVRSQQKREVSRVKELQEKLEQEITELKRKDAELKKLSHTEDHNQFLHNYPSLSPLSQNLEDFLLSQPEPKTRADFLQYSREITLDPNTAHTHLLLSDGNRKATRMRKQQAYSSHPDRFTGWPQVLSRESLTGCCYWEVERRGYGVDIAVTYKNISRAGRSNECLFGFNDKSWPLHWERNSYLFCHNKVQTPVSGPESSRVGVYLDHSAGILSFYSVSETMTLLHRVQTSFTQPLYAGFSLDYSGTTAELCELK